MTRNIATCKLAALLSLLTATACSDSNAPTYELNGSSMGTSYSVSIVEPRADFGRSALGNEIADRLKGLDENLSTYRPESELSRLNRTRGQDWIPVSAELCRIVEDAIEVSEYTDGAFDVTVGPLVNLWGFGPDGRGASPPSDHAVRQTLPDVGYQNLLTDCTVPAIRKGVPGVYIDLSAFAKGYAVDELAELLDARGVTNYLVEVGGELRLRGRNGDGRRWKIGIQGPSLDRGSVYASLELTDVAVATSGDYRNYFEFDGKLYSHTIDPRTGFPIDHNAASVTVVAETAARADALATALLVMGLDAGLAFAERESIAALFQARLSNGIEQSASVAFARFVAGPDGAGRRNHAETGPAQIEPKYP